MVLWLEGKNILYNNETSCFGFRPSMEKLGEASCFCNSCLCGLRSMRQLKLVSLKTIPRISVHNGTTSI